MNLRILFVDDEPNVLSGLGRMLHFMHREWNMNFVTSGEEAFKMIKQETYDVVVTDFRMPGMNGAQLLSKVQEESPDTVRIVLSGQSEQTTIIGLVGTAHQYLSKPCSGELLQSTIEKACWLRNITNQTVRKVTSQIKSIPSLPTVYSELIKELQNDNASLKSIGGIISQDVGMSMKVLQLVNSAYFGLPRHVANPTDAVILLGIETVMGLVLSAHIFSQFDQNQVTAFSIQNLMEHCFRTGILAKKIAKLEQLSKEQIDYSFIAGSLHDCGKLLLAGNLPTEYKAVVDLASNDGIKYSEAEKEVFGVTHAEVGGTLSGLWGLPVPVSEAILFHHNPSSVSEPQINPLTVVHAADALQYVNQNDSLENTKFCLDFLTKLNCVDKIPLWRKLNDE